MFCCGRQAVRRDTVGPAAQLPHDVSIMALTWNVGNAPPPDDFQQLFGDIGSTKPDLVIVGLQECAYEAEFEAFKDQEKPLQKRLKLIKDHFLRRVQVYLGMDYEPVVINEFGEMKIAVFGADRVVHGIRGIKAGREATGLSHVLANKGGLVGSFNVGDVRIALLCSHLAAHEGKMDKRNANVVEILGGTMGLSGSRAVDILGSHHHVIWMGDLNYRTNISITKHPLAEAEHEVKFKEIVSKVEAQDWDWLYANDELQNEIANRRIFCNFKEGPMRFHPTFKVLRQPTLAYLEQRLPSYCDRILWHSQPNVQDDLAMMQLEPLTHVATSDHKPVRGLLKLKTRRFKGLRLSKSTHSMQECIKLQVVTLEGNNLLASDRAEKSDPYVIFESLEELLVLKQKYKTSVKKATLNPKWDNGGELPTLLTTVRSASELVDHCIMMHVFDSDLTSKDDYLGSTCLHLADLGSGSQLDFDLPVMRFSRQEGSLKGVIRILRSSSM
eukprot:m.100598 g.100598  ORF g.100598 m.100598 type:complete len:498 (+) comp15133_c0_seq1:151-1644(+)